MAVNLTNLIDLDGLRAFKTKNDEARANAITKALDDYKNRDFVHTGSALQASLGSILVPDRTDTTSIVSGTGSIEDPYIVDFTVVYDDGESNRVYYKNTSSAESTASVASTSDIEALFGNR